MQSQIPIDTEQQDGQLSQFDLSVFVEQVVLRHRALHANAPSNLRMAVRHPFPEAISILPVDEELQPVSEPFTTIGKDISRTGIGFYHTHAISAPMVIIRFDGLPERGLLTRLVWCRFRRDGWYVSGGHFSRVVDCPRMPAGHPEASNLD